jgi:hypothetical protein
MAEETYDHDRFEFLKLVPVSKGFCLTCGAQWRGKGLKSMPKRVREKCEADKTEPPEYLKYGLWEVRGPQALERNQLKKTVRLCNDCLTALHLATKQLASSHLEWLREEKEERERQELRPRCGMVGHMLLLAMIGWDPTTDKEAGR